MKLPRIYVVARDSMKQFYTKGEVLTFKGTFLTCELQIFGESETMILHKFGVIILVLNKNTFHIISRIDEI